MVMQAGVQSDGRLGSAQAASAGDVDLGALGRALWRQKVLIGGLTLLAAAIAFAVVNFITPRYKSQAWVLIETRENIFFRPDAEKALERGTTVDQEAVTSQIQLILSRDLAREVIKKLKLAERPEFDPILEGPSPLRTVLALTHVIKDPMEMTPEERVFKSYYERLQAFQVEKSRVIAIEFESQDPELAANVANAIADGLGAAATDARIISTATVSNNTPSWPKKLPTVLVAALAMLVLSSGFVLSSELLSASPAQPTAVAAAIAPAAAEPIRDLRAAIRADDNARAGVPPGAVDGLAREIAEGHARRITVVGVTRDVGASMAAIALARSLARQTRVVLVDLALGAPALSIIAGDPATPGIAELVAGTASFGQIITRDRYSRVHLIMAGCQPIDAAAIMSSQRLSITIEALARSYDHVVVDAGTAGEAALERLAQLAPRAVLVAAEVDDPAIAPARERLLQAGFADVSLLAGVQRGAELGTAGAQAAA
jgi:Mrp family chromosome partitioning ATPase/capsular polysaccharide biosynthesis protein